jgi:hypothetical protein
MRRNNPTLYGKGFDLTVDDDAPAEGAEIVAGMTADNVLDTGETEIMSGLPTALVVAGLVGVAAIFAWRWYR